MDIDNKKYYYVNSNKESVGPFTHKEFENLHLPAGTKIWYTGLKEWIDYIPPSKKPSVDFKFNKKWLYYVGGFVAIVLLIWIIVGVSSASKIKRQIVEGAYDCEDFDMYLDKYYRDLEFFGISKRRPRTIIMRLAPMQYFEDTKDYHGVSYGYKNDNIIEIYINEDSWKRLSRPQKYLLMYHELSHDVLNLDDLPAIPKNEGKLMCPVILSYDKITMDNFIEMAHKVFENY